jgi:methionyl-tRNA formyltransferase
VQGDFLAALAALEPDLCVTAGYGNMLPQKLLDIPRFGTLNIHPSLLPKYRGAAPVNRCLENGDSVTGVSLAYTVLKCDAGPVLAQQELLLQGNEQVRLSL